MPSQEQALGLIGIILALCLLVWLVRRPGRRVDLKLGSVQLSGGDGAATEVATEALAEVIAAQQLRLDQYGEVATALVAVINAGPAEIETAAREWFSTLASRLAHLLRQKSDHHYRVAIWLDDPNHADVFLGVGYGLFDQHDDNMDRLERAYTIGGIAFTSRTGDYYCRDTQTDPNFKPRKTVPPSFRSAYGLALGRLEDPWGVVTIDARATNGFPDDARLLIRRFAELASLGAILWASKASAQSSEPAGPSS